MYKYNKTINNWHLSQRFNKFLLTSPSSRSFCDFALLFHLKLYPEHPKLRLNFQYFYYHENHHIYLTDLYLYVYGYKDEFWLSERIKGPSRVAGRLLTCSSNSLILSILRQCMRWIEGFSFCRDCHFPSTRAYNELYWSERYWLFLN